MRFGLRELIFMIVLLSVPIASFVFVFKPRNDEIQQAKSEIEEKQYKLAQLKEVSTRIEDIGEAIQEWRGAVERIEAKLPSAQGIDEILGQGIPWAAKLAIDHARERILIFHERVDAAELINKVLLKSPTRPITYHSRLAPALRRDNLALYRNGDRMQNEVA